MMSNGCRLVNRRAAEKLLALSSEQLLSQGLIGYEVTKEEADKKCRRH